MKRVLVVLLVLVVLAAVGGLFTTTGNRVTNRVVRVDCGDLSAYARNFGYFNSQLYPLGTVLAKEPGKSLVVVGYAAGRNPEGMPESGGRDRNLAFNAVIQGAPDWAEPATRAQIEQAASRAASLTVHNSRLWYLLRVEDGINNKDLRRQIRQHLAQHHPAAVVNSVVIADGLSITTTAGADINADLNLGMFGRNNVTAGFACSAAGRMKGKNIPVAFDVMEIEDPGPSSQLRAGAATPGAWRARD